MNEIVTSAERLIPLICELRHTTEQDRRIAAPIVQALRDSDLSRMPLDTGAPPLYTPEEWLSILEDASGRRSIGVLAHLEQHAALFLGPLLGCRWARTDFRQRQAVVRGLHTTDRTGRDHGRWVPAEWPLVSRVWLRAG